MISADAKRIMIFTASMARKLIQMGYKVVDIKPDRNDPDGKRTVFVFDNDNDLYKVVNDLTVEKGNAA